MLTSPFVLDLPDGHGRRPVLLGKVVVGARQLEHAIIKSIQKSINSIVLYHRVSGYQLKNSWDLDAENQSLSKGLEECRNMIRLILRLV